MPQSNLSAAPEMNLVNTRQERKQAGIGQAYVDQYNQAQMAKYNNEYNFWLWKQQQEYNSPKAQRARLEAAGLNPNFNSVDSGNVSSMPSSSGSVTPSIGANRQRNFQNAINLANSLLGSVKQGVDTMSSLSGIPADIKNYRQYLHDIGFNRFQSSTIDNTLKLLEKAYKSWEIFGTTDHLKYRDENGDFRDDLISEGPRGRQTNLRNAALSLMNDLRNFDLNNLKPLQVDKLNEEIDRIAEAVGFTAEQTKALRLSTNVNAAEKIGNLLIKLLTLAL
nr:MAG: DNA pilot protein [Microvirus sp.]